MSLVRLRRTIGSEMRIERPITAESRMVSRKLTISHAHNICYI